MGIGWLVPGCDRPRQSLAAALLGAILGSLLAITLGLDIVAGVVLAGALGGAIDLGAHLIVRDPQFEAALGR